MLKRAVVWLMVALIAALVGFSGWLDRAAAIAQTVALVAVLFSVMSLMFCLFEPVESEEGF